MRKILLLIPFLFFIVSAMAENYYVTDPNNCPTTYQSQTCTGINHVCGYSGGVTFCYDPAGIDPPASVQTSTTNYACSDTACDGGYVIDCYAYDGSAPHCDNGGNALCDRNSTCYGVNRLTNCTADAWVDSVCGNCRSGYTYCDGDFEDVDGCEVQSGSTNCPTGANNNLNSTCDCVCDANYLDCDGEGANETDGCEIHDGGECTVGVLSGFYDGCDGTAGNCVVSKSYFETGTWANYSTSDAMLWFQQFGSGNLMTAINSTNHTFNITQDMCMVGLKQVNATSFYQNNNKVADYSGGWSWGNLSTWDLNNTWIGLLGLGNISGGSVADNWNMSIYNQSYYLSAEAVPTCSKYYNSTGILKWCDCYNSTHKWMANTC